MGIERDREAMIEHHLREAVRMGTGWPKDDYIDRWIAERVRTLAEAVSTPQDTEWEYQCRLADNPWTKVADRTHGVNCPGTMRRRRKAGPWEPVPTEGVNDR